MQSGNVQKQWVLEFQASSKSDIEPLMGWTSSNSTQEQICLTFNTSEEAISYAKKHNLDYEKINSDLKLATLKSYAANFK